MATPMAAWLSLPYSKQVLAAVNADKTIGPLAPGDGDILQWLGLVCQVAIFDLHECRQTESLSDPSRFTWDGPLWPKPNAFDVALMDMVQRYFSLSFKHLEPLPELLNSNIVIMRAAIEMEIAIQWGGREVRVPKRRKIRNVRQRVKQELANGTAIENIPALVGISRATVFRILKEKN